MPQCLECRRDLHPTEEHYLSSQRPYCAPCATRVFDDIIPGPRRARRDLIASAVIGGAAVLGIGLSLLPTFAVMNVGAGDGGSGSRVRGRSAFGRLTVYGFIGTGAVVGGIHRATFAQYKQADMALDHVVRGEKRMLADEVPSFFSVLWSRRLFLGGVAAAVAGLVTVVRFATRGPKKFTASMTVGDQVRTPYGIVVAVRRNSNFAGNKLYTTFTLGDALEDAGFGDADVGAQGSAFGQMPYLVRAVDVAAGTITIELKRPE